LKRSILVLLCGLVVITSLKVFFHYPNDIPLVYRIIHDGAIFLCGALFAHAILIEKVREMLNDRGKDGDQDRKVGDDH
jgi:hypothetical protein